jgi:hypothetical protein
MNPLFTKKNSIPFCQQNLPGVALNSIQKVKDGSHRLQSPPAAFSHRHPHSQHQQLYMLTLEL